MTTTAAGLLSEAFTRVAQEVERLTSDATPGQLLFRPAPDANSAGWMLWHLARVQDDHVAKAFESQQVYPDWVERFALPFSDTEIGYGFDSAQVGEVRTTPELLAGYHAAVDARTQEQLDGLEDNDLDRVVDSSYDPPVTLQVRLVSVLQDTFEHLGQAAYVLGSLL